MHRVVCDYDSLRNQADGEPQRVAGAEGRSDGDFVFEVVLQGIVRAAYCVGVGQSAARGFREASFLERSEGLAGQDYRSL